MRILGSKTSVAGAEIFVLLVRFLHGPAAAALAAAGEATAQSARTSKRLTSWLGSSAMAALAMYACGSAFSVALLLVAFGATTILVGVAIIAMFQTILHLFFRQGEADERLRQ